MKRSLLLSTLPLLVMTAGAAAVSAQGPPSFPEASVEERIEVERIVVDVFITDSYGAPLEGLTAADLRAWLGGERVEIEAVEWIAGSRVERMVRRADGEEPVVTMVRRGRLIVMLFQTDFQRARVRGHIRMITHAKELLAALDPDDRVAVLSYDSRLKVRQDFTADRGKLERAIERSILIDNVPQAPREGEPSLVALLDERQAWNAATPERALKVIGDALRPIGGPKTLVLFGWGLGYRMKGGIVTMGRDYHPAKRSLEASRTAVFSLDISDADWHTLEVGLGKVSNDTGGFYQKTHIFPRFAIERLQRTISGHYEVTLVRNRKGGIQPLRIDLARPRRDVYVLHRSAVGE